MRRFLAIVWTALLGVSCNDITAVGGTSGITGRLTRSPMCPVERTPPDPGCEPAALAAPLQVRDESGRVVARTTSGTDGQYKVALAPGHYVIHGLPVSPSGSFPTPPAPVEVNVSDHAWTTVDLGYDTGIR